jgi:tRNA nucleotidyltransferase/poly(A) polymerase
VQISPHRNGSEVSADLAHRDFRVLDMALDPLSGQLLDPHAGLADLEQTRLRAVGEAEARLREEPLRLLRAARLVATHGYVPDRELVLALASRSADAADLPAAGVRRELSRLLRGDHAGTGLDLLRRCEIESALVPGVAKEAAAWVQALPPRLPLRLAAWLRGAHPGRALHRLRFDPQLRDRVLRLLQLHPIEQTVSPHKHSSLRRLLSRVPAADIDALFELRVAELSVQGDPPAAVAALAALGRALAQLASPLEREQCRPALALSGEQVMAILGGGPGPRVGRALHFLRERIRTEPGCNEPEKLTVLLRAWAAEVQETSEKPS